jgi:hypothetical protein
VNRLPYFLCTLPLTLPLALPITATSQHSSATTSSHHPIALPIILSPNSLIPSQNIPTISSSLPSPHHLRHHLITTSHNTQSLPCSTSSLPLTPPHHFHSVPLQVIQLSSGMCVALEVRAENAVSLFRETAGTVYSFKYAVKITEILVEKFSCFL